MTQALSARPVIRYGASAATMHALSPGLAFQPAAR